MSKLLRSTTLSARPHILSRPLILARPSPLAPPKVLGPVSAARAYASESGLSREAISERVMEVMKSFEKVNGSKVSEVWPSCRHSQTYSIGSP